MGLGPGAERGSPPGFQGHPAAAMMSDMLFARWQSWGNSPPGPGGKAEGCGIEQDWGLWNRRPAAFVRGVGRSTGG